MISGMNATPRFSPDQPPLPDLATAQSMLTAALVQSGFARRYTLELLAATPPDRWYEIPAGLPTHIAWQVGHLTVSQYGLLLFRIRGRKPADLNLIPGKFRKAFARGSTAVADPAGYPDPEDLLARLSSVWDTVLQEMAELDPAVLLEPVEMPYASYPIKLGAILFSPLHEHIHAGQIGLIRRGLGLNSVR